jgi:hypothetical protein
MIGETHVANTLLPVPMLHILTYTRHVGLPGSVGRTSVLVSLSAACHWRKMLFRVQLLKYAHAV